MFESGDQVNRLAIALLAAGSARRFGGDKLLTDFGGQPLAHYAASMLSIIPASLHVAIIRPNDVQLGSLLKAHGFAMRMNGDHALGLSRSIHTAVDAADKAQCDALLIALADMPFVSAAHILAMVAAQGDEQVLTSAAGDVRSPPAIFPKSHWADLRALTGDRGAATVLATAKPIEIDPNQLADVDTPEMRDRLIERHLR